MADVEIMLRDATIIEGATGVALLDSASGMTPGAPGGVELDPSVASTEATDLARARARRPERLDRIADILIPPRTRHTPRRPNSRAGTALLVSTALDRPRADLAPAGRRPRHVDTDPRS